MAVFAAAPPELADYPDRLSTPRVERTPVKPAWGLLALLVLFALIPRALMAFRVGVVCSDGAYYIQLAEALQRGDFAQALNMQFNVFPVVLAGLHRLGFSWEVAGKVWGVTMSTLVVLPLFGWARRQFDDRVAAVACALYAIHPELIEWSPEVVREPTFWFAFTLTIYLLWRAVTEVRITYFIAAGAALTFSALTRFEGLFLLVPLVAWSAIRWWSLREQRMKLFAGTVACPFALPALLLILNLCWLHHDCSWQLLRLEPLKRVEHWVASWVEKESASDESTVTPPQVALVPMPTKRSRGDVPWLFAHTLERGLTPFFGLLLLGGYLAWMPIFNRRDQVPTLIVGALVCGGIWIHLWYTNQSSGRYVMSIVIMSTRCAALGLISLSFWFSRAIPTWMTALRSPGRTLAGIVCMLAVIGWIDALTTKFRSREMSAELGDWIRQHFGEQRVIFGTDEQMAIISYHARANYWEPPRGVAGESLVDLVDKARPEVIVVANGAERAKDFAELIHDGSRIGFNRVDPKLLPNPSDRVVVLSRLPMVR